MEDEKLCQSITGDHNLQVAGSLHVVLPLRSVPQPTSVVLVIRKLDEVLADSGRLRRDYGDPIEIDNKLSLNQVELYRRFILDYGRYGHAVEGAYSALNATDPSVGRRVTGFIRSLYRDIEASEVGLTSDKILRSLIERLRERAGQVPDVPAEQLDPACSILIAHAFVNCTILERVVQAGEEC